MSIVRFPNTCNETAIFRFCTEVAEQAGTEELLIDFSSMGRIEPFSMAYVAKNIRDFYRNNKNTSIRCIGYENKEYAAKEILQNFPRCLVGVSRRWQSHGHEAKQP